MNEKVYNRVRALHNEFTGASFLRRPIIAYSIVTALPQVLDKITDTTILVEKLRTELSVVMKENSRLASKVKELEDTCVPASALEVRSLRRWANGVTEIARQLPKPKTNASFARKKLFALLDKGPD